MKIALLADLHYAPSCPGTRRRGDIAPILLRRAVRRLNRLVRPDVTLVLGDLLDDGTREDAPDRLARLRAILDKLECPYLAIPGNHDGDPERFYRVFERPGGIVDIAGARFLTFLDAEAPGHNATRAPRDLARFQAARADFPGLIVALQHVCLFPPGTADAPYNYTNAEAILAAMREAGPAVSVSGHYHRGTEDVRQGDLGFVCAPALCEPPFPFTVLTADARGHIATQRHALAIPASLGLVDAHLHSPLAYCSEDMDVPAAIGLARDFGLRGLAFAEHSGQLYFDRKTYWSKACLRTGMAAARPEHDRTGAYLELKRAYGGEGVRFGLEADVDYAGNLLLAPGDRARFDGIVGAVHGLPSPATEPAAQRDFLFLVERILAAGATVLAHPFRVFRRSDAPVPEALFLPTARLLRRYGAAAEINVHTNDPPVAFLRLCLELGVRFSLASDAHELSEVGDFAHHLALLEQAGLTGNPAEVIVDPARVPRRSA